VAAIHENIDKRGTKFIYLKSKGGGGNFFFLIFQQNIIIGLLSENTE